MRAVWQIIQAQYRHDPLFFGLGILVAILPAAAGVLLLGVSGWFITAAAVAGTSGVFLNIFAPSAIIRALAIVRTAGRYGERVLTHDATFRFLAGLRNRIFSAMAGGKERGQRSGMLLNRLTLDIAALDTLYLRLVVPIALVAVISVALLLAWASVSGLLVLMGFVFLGAWAALAWISFARADKKNARRVDAASDAMRLRTVDLVAGRRDLAIYGGLADAAQTVSAADERLADAMETQEERSTRLSGYSALIGQLFLASTLAVCVWLVVGGEITASLAAGLVLVVMALPELFSMTLPGLANLPRVALAAARTSRRMNVDGISAIRETPSEGEGARLPNAKALSFRNVSFRYPGAGKNVLQNLSLDIAKGEIVAIAGRSGCGKSTLASLAARLLEPGEGRVSLNGEDLQDIAEDNLRRNVTVLSQRAYLFNDTVAANLRVADPKASDAELWRALDQAALADRIARNPEGLRTVLGEGGIGLSGGEQRRLALARAFLTRPVLYILDEMTEGLDEETAKDVLFRFSACRGDTAVLMIAHKQREIDLADKVLHLTGKRQAGNP